MTKRVETTHLSEGQWFRVANRKDHYEVCCDCGLEHRVEYRVRNGKLEFRAWREDRATAARRRAINC